MGIQLIDKASDTVVSVAEAKMYLRIDHGEEDELLMHLIRLSTSWVEQETGRSLLRQKWSYTHTNTTLDLPHGPVTSVESIRVKRRILRPSEYEVEPYRSSLRIKIPFVWGRVPLTVVYWAGFGDRPEDVPLALRHAVMTTLAHIYENRSTTSVLGFPPVEPWIQYHRRMALG